MMDKIMNKLGYVVIGLIVSALLLILVIGVRI
ncbi:hypothetical protein SAMN05444955_103288 [Lihuaxuella thermophila]|uniref:Uncharacterized protein n=1 Tax=Lihuaxuella thermophila TaxID=1173111 RepID=A0A1H8CJ77_9BACL|nr:hypothetical protein SAMN05444955_103288 [Lihuaxuella thermophila]